MILHFMLTLLILVGIIKHGEVAVLFALAYKWTVYLDKVDKLYENSYQYMTPLGTQKQFPILKRNSARETRCYFFFQSMIQSREERS